MSAGYFCGDFFSPKSRPLDNKKRQNIWKKNTAKGDARKQSKGKENGGEKETAEGGKTRGGIKKKRIEKKTFLVNIDSAWPVSHPTTAARQGFLFILKWGKRFEKEAEKNGSWWSTRELAATEL